MVATENNLRISRQVGGALRRLRLERRLAMKQVAARAGITKPMLSRYELGRQHPSLPNLVKVLRALDCSAEDFGRHLGPWGCLR
ncbi:MAG TPA: helix-turn-helix transcriptional regulator [Thermoanaerobaculia bacterium]|nr:helix-turn-helix transcriptional regulator [Thermoanaerobaculia bacterium]